MPSDQHLFTHQFALEPLVSSQASSILCRISYRALEHITAACRRNSSGHLSRLLTQRWDAIDSQRARDRHSGGISHPPQINLQWCGRAHGDRVRVGQVGFGDKWDACERCGSEMIWFANTAGLYGDYECRRD